LNPPLGGARRSSCCHGAHNRERDRVRLRR
jgi:hypothetical protein